MLRIILQALLVLLLSGCRITTTIVGEGTIISESGNFNCTTGNVGDCVEDYQTGGAETLEAVPAPGWTFVRWTNCNYVTLSTCSTAFGLNTNNDVWPITATFKPIDPPAQSATYTYNALGQRLTKTVGNVTTLFQYDLDGNLIAELNRSGQALRQHVHINGEPIAQLSRNTAGSLDVNYVHSDYLGAPTLLTNQGGKVVADFEAAPFGETYIDYAEVEYNKRFPGQYKDVEAGLHYNYFRGYDPTTGRYIQSDPIGLEGGINTYTYVDGNPVSWFDPFGLLRYNKPPPRTVPPEGDTLEALQCVEDCLKKKTDDDCLDLLVTGGAEKTGHSKNSHHYIGEAVDIAGPKSNPVTNSDVMHCAAQCGFGAGLYEDYPKNPNRNHWHLQLRKGNGVPAISKQKK